MTPALAKRLQRMLAGPSPVLIVIAGSNGAGKSTFQRRYLADSGLPFVNADNIAARMQPGVDSTVAYRAMQVAETLREELLQRRQSFCMETVFSDTFGAKLIFIQRAQRQGYRVVLVAIVLLTAELSQARVWQRVQAGGHDVPTAKLLARFPRTQENIQQALLLVDVGVVLDNSSFTDPFRLLQYWEQGRQV
jgi:predicted ABC-type ATPase